MSAEDQPGDIFSIGQAKFGHFFEDFNIKLKDSPNKNEKDLEKYRYFAICLGPNVVNCLSHPGDTCV